MQILLAVDVQKGFRIPAEIIQAVKDWQNYCDYTIATQYKGKPKGIIRSQLNWAGLSTKEEQQLLIEPDLIVPKTGYQIPGKIIEHIRSLNPQQVVIAGAELEACVQAIAHQLFEARLPFIIDTAACASSPKTNRDWIIGNLKRNFGNRVQ